MKAESLDRFFCHFYRKGNFETSEKWGLPKTKSFAPLGLQCHREGMPHAANKILGWYLLFT